MTMQTNRLFEIIYLLLSHGTVTAKQLADRFEVSSRTIYRDIDTLSLAGIPVYTEKGKGGGIRLLDEFVLNKSVLSADEQKEILTALQGLSALRTTDTQQVLEKLGSFFGHKAVNWIEVDYSDWSFCHADVFQLLKTAILEKRIITFTYHNTAGEKSLRRVEPMQLWFKSKAWYLKAFCLAKTDVRTFKITRIRNLKLADEVFPERDLLKAVTAEAPPAEHQPDVALTLHIAADRAYRVYDEFDECELKENDDGSFTVTIHWPEDEWLYAMILSYTDHIRVVSPPHIRRIVAQKARAIAEMHEEKA